MTADMHPFAMTRRRPAREVFVCRGRIKCRRPFQQEGSPASAAAI